jgi:NADH pyrophosphatase NudC (nudix superfamily)
MGRGPGMSTAFTRRYSEDSADGRLQYTFYCDICHREYAAPAIETPGKQRPFQKWKLRKAYAEAFDRAQEDAMEHFNRCVKCMRWVCDEDFSPDCGFCTECDRENRKGK